jgi:carboxypeptidase C (cathepsin A)
MTKPQPLRALRWLALGGVVVLSLGQAIPASDWRLIAPAAAEDAKQRPDRPRESEEPKRLPADVTTEHTVDLPGRALRFKATAGSIPIMNAGGKLIAEVAYVAYTRSDVAAAGRPVTFAFNGGPGAASAYLQLGAMGPWRLPLDRIAPSTPPSVVPNAETWLDFTDLVFVDPPATGYSRVHATGDERKSLWSVDGDAEALATFVRKWIEAAGRHQSPKYITGESYGGFRALKVTRALRGTGINGLVLVSPVLDFGWRGQHHHAPLPWVVRLPSMAATHREATAPFDREALREVERYAAGEYLVDLLRGPRDAEAVERISTRVAELTGLDRTLVRRLAGRVDYPTYLRELKRERGLVGSAYDATVASFDPDPNAASSHSADPVLSGMSRPLSSAMVDVYQGVLQWRVDAPYRLLNREVDWDWGRGRTTHQIVDDLRGALALDPRLHVLVTHGASDLVTPYFENQLIIDQVPAFGSAERLRLAVYGGGHMFYSRDLSRRTFREDAERLYRAAAPVQEQRTAAEPARATP